MNEVDGLVQKLGDDARNKFVVGCIREILAFERTKAKNLSKLGMQSDDQVMQDIRRVLANFGHNFNRFLPAD